MAASTAQSPISLSESRAYLNTSAPPSRRKRRQRSRKSTHNKVMSVNETSQCRAEQMLPAPADDESCSAHKAGCLDTYSTQPTSRIQSVDAVTLVSSTVHDTSTSSTNSEPSSSLPVKSSIPTETDSYKSPTSDKQPSPRSEKSYLPTSSEQNKLPSDKPESLPSKPTHSQCNVPNNQQLQPGQQKTAPPETAQDDTVKGEASAKYTHHKQLVSKMKTLRQLINDTSDKTAVAQEEIKAMKLRNEMAFKKDDVRTVITNKMCINVLKSTIREAQSNQQRFYELYKTLRDEVISSQWYQNNSRSSANSSRDVGRV